MEDRSFSSLKITRNLRQSRSDSDSASEAFQTDQVDLTQDIAISDHCRFWHWECKGQAGVIMPIGLGKWDILHTASRAMSMVTT